MRQILPPGPGPGTGAGPGPRTGPQAGRDVAADAGTAWLAGRYAYPPGDGRPWLRANMVSSADGAASLRGRSRGLSGDADRLVFAILRALADVVIVGAQTARVEHYRPVQEDELPAGLRAGRPATPPIAVVSRRADLDPQARLFTAAPAHARTIVITTGLAPQEQRAKLAAVADVIVAGAETAGLGAALAALAARGHRRLLTEGGPHLLGQLAGAGLLDELCLTVSPLLAGPGASRIMASPGLGGGPAPAGIPLSLGHVLEDDGFLLCRYTTRRQDSPPGGLEERDPR